MKRSIKILIVILVICLIIIGLIPNIAKYLSYKQYTILILSVVYLIFELILILKLDNKMSKSFNLMRSDIRLNKEEEYKENQDFYYREIPFKKDLFKFFWFAYQYDLIENKANILNALILKWVLESRVKYVSENKLIFNDDLEYNNNNETILFMMMKNSSRNNTLNLNKFNAKIMMRRIDQILLEETNEYRKQNKILVYKDGDYIAKELNYEADKVYGIKNFLTDFSNIDEKRIIEVKLWNEYLIYAEILGISDQVRNELDKMNVNYATKELKIRKINVRIINTLNVVVLLSYLFYGFLFLLFTSFIWIIYIKITYY